MKKFIGLVTLALVACGGGEQQEAANDGPRGVSDDRIVIGSHTDLSGTLAIWGVPLTNGQRMRYDEVNAAGGIHGRQIEFIVEDTQYQMPLAIKATNKLLNVDDIFLMVGSMGTPMNIALMPRMFEVDVPSLFPLTAAVQMHEPLHPMKFNYFVSYRDQIRGGMMRLVEQTGVKKVCMQAVANDYGHENEVGFESAVAQLDLHVVYAGRHKTTETDFRRHRHGNQEFRLRDVGAWHADQRHDPLCTALFVMPAGRDLFQQHGLLRSRDIGSGEQCDGRFVCGGIVLRTRLCDGRRRLDYRLVPTLCCEFR